VGIEDMGNETVRWVVLAISFAFTLLVWWRLLRFNEHPILKFLIGIVALIPVIGPLVGLWLVGMPDVQPRKFWATLNHYGRGGRFIGFGSGRFTHGDMSETGKDWNPTVPDLLEQKKKRRK
jgi:hypothetical protein